MNEELRDNQGKPLTQQEVDRLYARHYAHLRAMRQADQQVLDARRRLGEVMRQSEQDIAALKAVASREQRRSRRWRWISFALVALMAAMLTSH